MGERVFTTREADIIEPPRDQGIPHYWAKACCLQIDGNEAAVLWVAIDDAEGAHVYAELYMLGFELPMLAHAIRKRGSWIPCIFDAKGRRRSKAAGDDLAYRLAEENMTIYTAEHDIEAGIAATREKLDAGQLKVGDGLAHLLSGYRRYRRDPEGELIEEDDLMMRALGMVCLTGAGMAILDTPDAADVAMEDDSRSGTTGY